MEISSQTDNQKQKKNLQVNVKTAYWEKWVENSKILASALFWNKQM